MTAFVRHLGVNTQVFGAWDCALDASHPGPTGHQECAGMMRQVHGLPFTPCLSPGYRRDFWFSSLPITFCHFIRNLWCTNIKGVVFDLVVLSSGVWPAYPENLALFFEQSDFGLFHFFWISVPSSLGCKVDWPLWVQVHKTVWNFQAVCVPLSSPAIVGGYFRQWQGFWSRDWMRELFYIF